jgi:hypothetical protein
VPKVILWLHRCHRSQPNPSIITKNPASLTANDFKTPPVTGIPGESVIRGVLVLVESSIAPSTIIDIKTAEVSLNLRVQGISGASLNAWGLAGGLAFFGAGVAVIALKNY